MWSTAFVPTPTSNEVGDKYLQTTELLNDNCIMSSASEASFV